MFHIASHTDETTFLLPLYSPLILNLNFCICYSTRKLEYKCLYSTVDLCCFFLGKRSRMGIHKQFERFKKKG